MTSTLSQRNAQMSRCTQRRCGERSSTLSESVPNAVVRSLPHNLRGCKGDASCEGKMKAEAAEDASRSQFCMIAAGDTPSTGRLYDAISCLCVPMIAVDDLQLPFPHVLRTSTQKPLLPRRCLWRAPSRGAASLRPGHRRRARAKPGGRCAAARGVGAHEEVARVQAARQPRRGVGAAGGVGELRARRGAARGRLRAWPDVRELG